MARALPWAGLAVRLGAGAIWLVAGAAKLADLQHFHAQVNAYDVLPASLATVFAYTLPLLEVAVGLYLLVGLLVRPAAIVSCLLMAVFIVAMAQAWARGLSLDCGCFGAIAKEPVGLGSVARDAALGIPGLLLVLWPARRLSLDERWLGLPDRWVRARGPHPPTGQRKSSALLRTRLSRP